MSQVPADNNDPRSRHASTSYGVTYCGKSKETGPSGYASRLSASYNANILTKSDAGETAAVVVGDLTQGLAITGLINHAALTSGTLVFTLPAHNGAPEIIVNTQAVDLTATSVIFTGINPLVLAPLAADRPMTVTITGGTADEVAVVSLMVTPIESGWK